MNHWLLAQGIDFQQIIKDSLPGYTAGKIDVTMVDNLTIGYIISKILPYIFVIAGLILFIFLIVGGFELLTSAGNPESIKKGQEKITSALVGFIIIFLAYWLTQALEIIFGIKIFLP